MILCLYDWHLLEKHLVLYICTLISLYSKFAETESALISIKSLDLHFCLVVKHCDEIRLI